MSVDSVADLWDSYHRDPSRQARDRLIIHYSPLVKYVAGRVAVGLPQNVEQSDLVSYGIFGLIDAIEKFDQGRGFKFETYAIARIKGAILDELRAVEGLGGGSSVARVDATGRSFVACAWAGADSP